MADERLAGIIVTAIKREEEAYAFYTDLIAKVDDPSAKDTLALIAVEEQKHRQFLVDYHNKGCATEAMRMSEVIYYKIAEYQQEPAITINMASQDVFLIAAHRELRSFQFYTDLAQLHSQGDTARVLLAMANEELKHKEKMEYLYANTAFPQTAGG
jgi:rubrerythrin